MDPVEARRQLLDQHRRLRELLTTAGRAAELERADLEELLVAIREAFLEHNRFEASLLGPLLRDGDEFGPQRISRMLEEHAEEHRIFSEFIARPIDEIVPELAAFAEEVFAHMDAEERTFLHPAILS